jgi:magnesium chelatase family protein
VTVVRGQLARVFPTRFVLVAATNPCPCGFGGDSRCSCSEAEIARHRKRLSGPLLDRLDLMIAVRRVTAEELDAGAVCSSAEVRERVAAARERQVHRLAGSGVSCNGQMDASLVTEHVRLTAGADRSLLNVYRQSRLSTRGHQRVLRVARTIADLEGSDRVRDDDVMRALQFRERDAELEAAA